MAFQADAPVSDLAAHSLAIDRFRQLLETAYRGSRERPAQQAAVVVGDDVRLQSVAEDVADLLRRQGFGIIPLVGRRPGRGLEDIRLLEWLRSAELCVFILGEHLADEHIALAMAHADCIPSLRLQHSVDATTCEPEVSGLIRWRDRDEMLIEFKRQLASYQAGLVLPVDRALATTAKTAARSIGTMRWQPPRTMSGTGPTLPLWCNMSIPSTASSGTESRGFEGSWGRRSRQCAAGKGACRSARSFTTGCDGIASVTRSSLP